MILKRTIVAAAIAVLSAVGLAAQDNNATFTLTSGERITGQLVDMGGSSLTVRVNGNERKIPNNQVALINFAGGSMSQADWDRVTSGQHVIWLRNGETITGQVFDVSGTTPKVIHIRSNGAERELRSNEINRIAMARPSDVAATTGSGGGGNQITVSAQQRWTPTGITVREGETLQIRAEGDIRLSPDTNDRATASGVVSQRFDPQAPLPRVLAGALIGRIGSGEPFGVGTSNTFKAPAAGQLFLGINDSNVSDNQGSFQVTVERQGGAQRR